MAEGGGADGMAEGGGAEGEPAATGGVEATSCGTQSPE